MQISIVNLTRAEPDQHVARVIRAIHRQIREHFEPHWRRGATLRLSGIGESTLRRSENPSGDAVIYLGESLDALPDALALHAEINPGVAHGFVFTEVSERLGEAYSVTLSHEVLELIGDATTNAVVAGPHPEQANELVFHWYELCDAVQDEAYEIDGVQVSNFVLPSYFTTGTSGDLKNDFVSVRYGGASLRSFGIKAGGYVGYYDPRFGGDATFTLRGDTRASERLAIKRSVERRRLRARAGRRAFAPALRGPRALGSSTGVSKQHEGGLS